MFGTEYAMFLNIRWLFINPITIFLVVKLTNTINNERAHKGRRGIDANIMEVG